MYSKTLLSIVLAVSICLSVNLFAQNNPGDGSGGNRGDYLTSWWLSGPFPVNPNDSTSPSSEKQKDFFDEDIISRVDFSGDKPLSFRFEGKNMGWQPIATPGSIVNLDSIFGGADFASAFAVTTIVMDEERKMLLMIGSDDALKVWLNGHLVHENWVARALTPDEDLIFLPLVKGVNQLLVMVQDIQADWGFTAKIADEKALTERLTAAAGDGQLGTMKLLTEAGAALDGTNTKGFTPLGRATFKGRKEAADQLRQNGAIKSVIPSPEQQIDQFYRSASEKGAPGIAVLVARDGNVVFKKGFGYADIERRNPIEPGTSFRIGSITKQFTAAAILKLQEQGKLSVTDKLSKYFPDFPKGNEVTLHHLLTHTSGIHSYTGKGDFLKKVTTPVTTGELYDYFKNDPYDFSPGEQFRYNNSGYFLLGMIVEKVSGLSYAKFLDNTFFSPLKMKNTGVHSSTLSLSNEALGYGKENGVYTRALPWDMSWAGGAGALYSTVEDLFRWNEALYNGKVLSATSLKEALTPVKLNNGAEPTGVRYGYGLFSGKYRGTEVITHAGGLHGFISQLAWYPKDKMTVVMLTNLSPSEFTIDPNALAEAYMWREMDSQSSYAELAASGDHVLDYTGRYDFKDGRVMIITAEGENLFAQLSGQPKFPIYPSAPDEYFWKVVEAKIKFVKNDSGRVTHGHFEQGGFVIDAARLGDEIIISVDPAIYKSYLGKYDFGNGMQLDVTSEEGKLFIQATNQPKFEILPLSRTVFTVKDLNARVTFDEPGDGTSAKLVIDMGGQKTEAPRIVD